MKINVLTLFPEMIENAFKTSITGRAIEEGLIELHIVNIRDYTLDKHMKVDDYTYGGGAGMLMQAQPVYDAFKSLNVKEGSRVIYLSPVGKTFNQDIASLYSKEEEITLLCGHYEGIDERVIDEIVTDRLSIGDFVLTGGELAALVVMDAFSRLIPGVLGNEISASTESFDDYLLEYPQFSRPTTWMDKNVPEVLLSGDHKKIEEWRLDKSIEVTKLYRPDLYEKWASSHPEYFEMLEKKKRREEEKAKRRLKKINIEKDLQD